MLREESSQKTPLEIERRLIRHYLRTDGAGGAGPLRYIDASDLELAEALGASSPSDALRILYEGCGGGDSIARVLSEGWHARWQDRSVPGFFRYLILTCTVVALADTDRNSREFGRNLQRIFHTQRTFSSRRALPNLWNKLATWCRVQRERGEPIRQLDLPERGPGIHIGLTNAISFPNWRDVLHLRNELQHRRHIIQHLKEPADAARLLCSRIHEDFGYSSAMIDAAREYHNLYLSRASLLFLHPFWVIVCRSLDLARVTPSQQAISVRIELGLTALAEDTELSVTVYQADPTDALISHPPYTCRVEKAIEQLLNWGKELAAASRWLKAFADGAVAFAQEGFGVWSASEAAPSASEAWLYLVRDRRMASLRSIPIRRLVRISPAWYLVGPLHGVHAQEVHAGLNLRLRETAIEPAYPFKLEGGVRTPAGWLGRASLLPHIRRQGNGLITLQPRDTATSQPTVVDIGHGHCSIEASEALGGSYRLRVEERAQGATPLAIEQQVRFVVDSPEHPELSAPSSDWRDEPEFSEAGWGGKSVKANYSNAQLCSYGEESPQPFDDFLELLYAGGRRGWAERDLVKAIATLLPGPSPWDILRALQEASWIHRTASVSWRATRWWLVEPHLVPLTPHDGGPVMLGGTAPWAVRRRFTSTSKTLGGHIAVRSGTGSLSPVTILSTGADLECLARELAWPIRQPQLAHALTAPNCWPLADVDVGRHRLHREWDWGLGRFTDIAQPKQKSQVHLTWWRREEGDRVDLYVVQGVSSHPFTTSSRTVALAEAFRQARQPMFELTNEALFRRPSEGHLPLQIAQALGILTLRRSGPLQVGDVWTYSYPTSQDGNALIASCFGRHYLVGAVRDTTHDALPTSSIIARARHRGRRNSRGFSRSLWI